MKIIKQVDIRPARPNRSRGDQLELRRIVPEYADEIFGVFLKGGVTSRTARPLAVEFMHEENLIEEIDIPPIRQERLSDLFRKPQQPGQPKFQLGLNLLGLPEDTTIEVRLRRNNAEPEVVAGLDISREKLVTGFDPLFNPIILQSMGRSGTTWFMHLLSMHPQIYIHREYPHELLSAHYWLNFLESLSTPLAGSRLVNKWNVRDSKRRRVVTHSYYRPGVDNDITRYMGSDYVMDLARFTQESIEKFYSMLVKRDMGTGANGSKIKYFSEKGVLFPDLVREIYHGARTVFLVRDIRDNICSALAFNKKRGNQAFGRGKVDTDMEFVRLRCGEFRALYASYVRNTGKVHLVRYEDLIMKPEQTLDGLFTYLDVDRGESTVNGVIADALRPIPNMEFHKTSESPEASINRWRSDMPRKLQEECRRQAGEALKGLGYSD